MNEDRVLARPEIGLWAVADGMGGHEAGDVASTLVVDALSEIAAAGSGFAYLNRVSAALQQANRKLIERSGGRQGIMGSTVVAFLAYEGHYACLWAGDSRAYRMRGADLTPVTHDHSLVQELVDAGALTAEQARTHPRANVITRAVGVAPALELEKRHAPIEPGDTFLLCSDGLSGVVSDVELAEHLARPNIESAADDLLALALRYRAKDNVSLVVVRADQHGPA